MNFEGYVALDSLCPMCQMVFRANRERTGHLQADIIALCNNCQNKFIEARQYENHNNKQRRC